MFILSIDSMEDFKRAFGLIDFKNGDGLFTTRWGYVT